MIYYFCFCALSIYSYVDQKKLIRRNLFSILLDFNFYCDISLTTGTDQSNVGYNCKSVPFLCTQNCGYICRALLKVKMDLNYNLLTGFLHMYRYMALYSTCSSTIVSVQFLAINHWKTYIKSYTFLII